MWYRRGRHRAGTGGPGWGYLVTGLVLTGAVTVVPLLMGPKISLSAWLWLSGEWGSGMFALLVIAVGPGLLARHARVSMVRR